MNDVAFEIRRASIEDIPAIQEITKEAFIKYIHMAKIKQNIPALEETFEDIKKDIETKIVLVAFVDGEPVGSVRVEVKPDKTAYFSRFGVRIDYQNGGVGKAMMSVVDIAMNEVDVKKLYLHTASKVFSLMRFYYARGFYVESTSKDRGYIRALLCKEY